MSTLKCLTCKRDLPLGKATPELPFCSHRCKLVDLGNWLSGHYVIPAEPNPDEELREEDLAALLREPS